MNIEITIPLEIAADLADCLDLGIEEAAHLSDDSIEKIGELAAEIRETADTVS